MTESNLADSALLQELHGYVRDLCVRLGSDPAEVPCDVWHLSDLINRQQSKLQQLERLERTLTVLDQRLQIRFSFMHEGTHWQKCRIDPLSLTLLAAKLRLLDQP